MLPRVCTAHTASVQAREAELLKTLKPEFVRRQAGRMRSSGSCRHPCGNMSFHLAVFGLAKKFILGKYLKILKAI